MSYFLDYMNNSKNSEQHFHVKVDNKDTNDIDRKKQNQLLEKKLNKELFEKIIEILVFNDIYNYNDLHFPIKLENKETNHNEDEEIHSCSKLF